MTLAEILASIFPAGHDVVERNNLLTGIGRVDADTTVHILGITGKSCLGVDEAVTLAGHILALARDGDGAPIIFLLDSGSQRMSRRDELLGLSETLAHLAKALHLAENAGHRTIGLLHGGGSAGALIATALACETLVALPGAYPEVMDLPSMARVTKLPLELLEAKAVASQVFAPGLDNIVAMGAVAEIWDSACPLADQLKALLARGTGGDRRAVLGRERNGRPKAADIATEVERLALAHG